MTKALVLASGLLLLPTHAIAQGGGASGAGGGINYTRFTMGAYVVLALEALLVGGLIALAVALWRSRQRLLTKVAGSRKQIALLAVLVVGLAVTAPVYAQDSCFGGYATTTNKAWGMYDGCIQETNDAAWYTKIAVRQLCRAQWLSDIWQAEAAYFSCMSGVQDMIAMLR